MIHWFYVHGGCEIDTERHALWVYLPQHLLYFLPLPQGQGWLRPILADRLAGFLFEPVAESP